MKKITAIIIMVLQAAIATELKAQVDPHFSQYYAYPLWLNPALTGVFDGDTRLNSNFRNQWAGISNGYTTGGLSMDIKPTEQVSLGFNAINQAAGTAGYNYFAAYGSFGYGITISGDGTKKINFGVQAGVINRSFDPSKLQLDNQYNPITGFDPSAPSFETFATTNATVFDANAGIFYYDSDPQKTANAFAGISAAHLNSPQDPFSASGIKSSLPVRFTIHGGVKIKASDFFDITPHAIYIRQQQNQITALGVYSEFKLQDNNGLILGTMVRINDAAIADVGYHIDKLIIGLSYDFNTSALRTATNGQGGFELSLSYVFGNHRKNPANVCPSF